jgi:mannose-6-phosphate isomerase-like protein (cupin superfamily)
VLERPLLRGVFHQVGFSVLLVVGTLLIVSADGARRHFAAAVFAGAVAACFGVSALYHRITSSRDGTRSAVVLGGNAGLRRSRLVKRESTWSCEAASATQKLAPKVPGSPGHRHKVQEEVYVVLSGSGRVKLEDEVRELRQWDALEFRHRSHAASSLARMGSNCSRSVSARRGTPRCSRSSRPES